MFRRNSPTTLLIIGFAGFMVSLVVYVVYTYQTTRQTIAQEIDSKLLNAAKTAQLMIGDSYHDELHTIDKTQYLALSDKLSSLAKTLEVEYLYSMVYEAPFVRFTSSSYTNDDLLEGKITNLLDPYPEATILNKGAFQSTEPVFEISEDQWGHFKTIFVPFISKEGKAYLVGADITTDSVDSKLKNSVTEAAFVGSFFFFIAILVASIYLLLYRRTLTTDPRTGFGNRIALEQDLKHHKSPHLSLAIISIHELENIVSFYGAQIGDQVVQKVMTHFNEQSKAVFVYRLATSKVVVLCNSERGEHFLSSLIQQFPMNTPILNHPHLYVQLNAGIASGNKALLLENAYVACRQAIQQQEAVCIYSIDRHEAKLQQDARLNMANTLTDALEHNRVQVYFTPRQSPKSNKVEQYLCSARVLDTQGAIIPQHTFADVVKQSRMEGQLTRHIFAQCITRFRKSNTAWSVRLSYQDACDPQLIDFISQELHRYPQPSLITFELDEQDVLDNFNAMAVSINVLKSKGVKILIHSVSSGLLTVSRVMKLSIDAIKLDNGITSHIHDDEQVFEFIKHLAKLCKDRGMQILVGHVKSNAQYDLLAQAGVNLIQGPYVGKPVPHTQQTEEVMPQL